MARFDDHGDGYGVLGTSAQGTGVFGTSGTQHQIPNPPPPPVKAGVRGEAFQDGYGVYASSLSGVGVAGESQGTDGVMGRSHHRDHSGVWGDNPAGGTGVAGSSRGGQGVFGKGKNGVHGQSSSPSDSGVWGENTGGGFGVSGSTKSAEKAGVWGDNPGGEGVLGTSASSNGVHGRSSSADDSGVWGENIGGGFGVSGSTDSVQAAGIWGDNPSGEGVRGTSAAGNRAGVAGFTSHHEGIGVFGQNSDSSAHGTLGGFIADGGPAVGVFGTARSGGAYSGFFAGPGKVHVVGTLEKGAGAFKIDHPLDPANKYLCHSFVESSDMKNVYDGVAILDAQGEAVVELPSWFETLNRDFRYQLTPIGTSGPNLYIADELSGNRFKIAGGQAGGKVSWQLTGIRHDPYAEQHRIPVEVEKAPYERGKYLHPAEYGMPQDKGIGFDGKVSRVPELPAACVEEPCPESAYSKAG
jgi:hypothetical protein